VQYFQEGDCNRVFTKKELDGDYFDKNKYITDCYYNPIENTPNRLVFNAKKLLKLNYTPTVFGQRTFNNVDLVTIRFKKMGFYPWFEMELTNKLWGKLKNETN